MESPEEQQTLIHEVRNKRVISQKEAQPTTTRMARYLKPIADNSNPPVPIPTSTPLLSEIFPHDILDWPTNVIFKGWNSPQRKWQQWVDSLANKHGSVWNQTGIVDAITGSVYKVQFNSDLLLGLAEFWCPETNTFVFPWGEAGLTLEDVAILGGLPVVGEGIGVPVSEELVGIVEEMERQRERILKSRAKKAAHFEWIKRFMEEEGGSEFEHAGFLSLWLSRFVFPSVTGEVIGRHVFPIAAALSKGIPVALAPAVLGNLYKDLRELKEKAMDSATICVSAPFQLLQLWAFEHFPLISPTPIPLHRGEPRIARWNKLNLEINLPLVRSALQLAENFIWRPYAADLENWRHPSYYKETEQSLCYSSNLDVELRSFFQCLKASELVSVDGCKEKYLPNRVAMQFGMDQDIPSDVSSLNFTGENVRFFVPPKLFEPRVSGRYMKWWKDMMVNRKAVMERRNELMSTFSVCFKEGGNGEGFHGSSASKSPIASVEARKSNVSMVSKILEGLGKLSPVSTKLDMNKKGESDSSDILSGTEDQISSDLSDDDYVPIATHYKNNGEGSPAMDSKASSSGHAKKSKVSIGSHTPKSCGRLKSSPVSTKPNLKQNHDAKSLEIPSGRKEQIACDSSDNDNVPIATRFNLHHNVPKTVDSSHQEFSCNQSQNVVSSTPKTPGENSRKRKFHATGEGISQEEETKKPTKGVAKEVKVEVGEVGCSVNEPTEIDELAGVVKCQTKGRERAKGVAEGETRRKAGESSGNPIDLDACGYQGGGLDLQRRVEKIEKLLGVNPY
ncbi:hypothetical protein RHSIM_Rhsim06G0216000 [Rhododendron simsii]|uniref:Aminotransferase-like plant mobile domain-containing protein n=1 Tax=Rhododendron simsii TaxID=118357 RepID=A0A834LND0_RHOSS|nr:hypothetical protein RHSIM_Rhsim06G0216000 [Rhododendron simsii]